MRCLIPLALLLLAPSGCSSGAVSGSNAVGELAVVPLTVQTTKGAVKLKVEVARSAEEQARGLMFRESLRADGGMIFPMVPPRHASFWMKNTVMSLDMIFIRPDRTIARIEPETIPHSLDPVISGEPVSAVLELSAGRAAELGISEGDRVIWDDKAN